MTFKHKAVIQRETNGNPIMLGPMMLKVSNRTWDICMVNGNFKLTHQILQISNKLINMVKIYKGKTSFIQQILNDQEREHLSRIKVFQILFEFYNTKNKDFSQYLVSLGVKRRTPLMYSAWTLTQIHVNVSFICSVSKENSKRRRLKFKEQAR